MIIGASLPTDSGDSFYAILGVAETATAEEIKHAYFKMVRQVRPENDPEAYHRFQEAGRVLSDPRRRREYDQVREAGRRIQILSDQAAAAVERDPQKAFTLLKAAIALAPDSPRPRMLLAHVLTRLSDYAGAEKQYRRLLVEFPADETLHYRFARCLFVQERYEESEKELGAAIRVNPCYHDAHVLLGRLYEKTGQFGAAIFALEKSIENDNIEDYADFDALLRLLVIHLRMENSAEAERTARRIIGILPPAGEEDPTNQTERAAKRMLTRAKELSAEKQTTIVRALAALGSRLPNLSVESANSFQTLSRETRIIQEATNIQEDALALPELKRLAAGLYLTRQITENERAARRKEASDALYTAVMQDARSVQSLIEYMRREYPFFCAEQDAMLSETSVRVARRIALDEEALASSKMLSAPVSDGEEISPTSPPRKNILGWLKQKK